MLHVSDAPPQFVDRLAVVVADEEDFGLGKCWRLGGRLRFGRGRWFRFGHDGARGRPGPTHRLWPGYYAIGKHYVSDAVNVMLHV